MKNKYTIQDEQYEFPYHYLVNIDQYSNFKLLPWGLEYYSYTRYTADYIKELKFDNLLDIGCGDGRLLNYLATILPDRKFVGADISEPAIYLAKGLNYRLHNTKFICEDIKNISDQFDVVVLNEVLEHISDELMPSFVSLVKSKIKTNGTLIVTAPSSNVPVQPKHYRHYCIEDILIQFQEFQLTYHDFIFRHNPLTKFFMALNGRLSFLKWLELYAGKTLMFRANKKNCKHIFCVFSKQTI